MGYKNIPHFPQLTLACYLKNKEKKTTKKETFLSRET